MSRHRYQSLGSYQWTFSFLIQARNRYFNNDFEIGKSLINLIINVVFLRPRPKGLNLSSVTKTPSFARVTDHFHDGVILLLRPESITFFLSYLNLVIPARIK